MAELPALKLERAEFIVETDETMPDRSAEPASTRSSSGCAPIPARGPGR
jgi:hypothetical protein